MDEKLLNERSWKDLAQKLKLKDNGLQRALSVFEKLPADKYADRLKALGVVMQLATALKRVKEVLAQKDAVKFLADLFNAAQNGQRELTKAKADAEKSAALAAKAEATALKKTEAEAAEAGEGEEDEEEDEQSDSITKLRKAILTLRMSKVPYYFLVCDAKPYGLVISKKDIRKSMLHRKELAKMAGGSTRPPKFGDCRFDSGKLTFEMEKPPSGLARILQKWIKTMTGLGLKIKVGTESAEDEEEQPGAEPPTVAKAEEKMPLQPIPPALERAPEIWKATRKAVGSSIDALKAAIRKQFGGEGDKALAEVEQNVKKLDRVFDLLDDRLTGALDKARAAKDGETRQAELKNTRTIIARFTQYVGSEALIAHLDSNPFGVKTEVKQKIIAGLAQMAKAA